MKKLRAAIYTRKSSEEGLDQEFNSLDAQREASEAYIASQRRDGPWFAPATMMAAGREAISSGPGLKALLVDVEAGRSIS